MYVYMCVYIHIYIYMREKINHSRMQSYNALMFKETKEAVASPSWKSRGSGLGRLQKMEYLICGPTEWQEGLA